MKPKVLAIIPARGGSKSLPRKNIRILGGKPLIAHTISHAQKCPLIDRIVVSTDDDEIARVSIEYGAEVPFKRPAEMSTDIAKTDVVLQHATIWFEQHGFEPDIVVWFHVTHVFRRTEWITKVIQNLIDYPDIESSFVVIATYKHYWVKKEGEYLPLSLSGEHIGYNQRQRMNPIFREECGIVCATRADIIKEGQRVGRKVMPVEVFDEIAEIDIHDEFDLWLAEKILTEWQGKLFKGD